MFSALGSALDGMLGEAFRGGEAFRDGLRMGANEIRNEARRARDEARRSAHRERAEARANHDRHHRNSHNQNRSSQNQYRPSSSTGRPSRNTNQRAGIPSIDEIIGDAFGSFDEIFRNHHDTHNHFHTQGKSF